MILLPVFDIRKIFLSIAGVNPNLTRIKLILLSCRMTTLVETIY